jgi:hypothetical protein
MRPNEEEYRRIRGVAPDKKQPVASVNADRPDRASPKFFEVKRWMPGILAEKT